MGKKNGAAQFALCVKNDDYPASLDVRKVYRVIPDAAGAVRHFLRIVDETGEDYLYPEEYFVPIDLPRAAVRALSQVS